ncbi:MAG: hypothetical protein Q7R95_08275 [bacterium]|nr:hypothetical protein [bacterium]
MNKILDAAQPLIREMQTSRDDRIRAQQNFGSVSEKVTRTVSNNAQSVDKLQADATRIQQSKLQKQVECKSLPGWDKAKAFINQVNQLQADSGYAINDDQFLKLVVASQDIDIVELQEVLKIQGQLQLAQALETAISGTIKVKKNLTAYSQQQAVGHIADHGDVVTEQIAQIDRLGLTRDKEALSTIHDPSLSKKIQTHISTTTQEAHLVVQCRKIMDVAIEKVNTLLQNQTADLNQTRNLIMIQVKDLLFEQGINLDERPDLQEMLEEQAPRAIQDNALEVPDLFTELRLSDPEVDVDEKGKVESKAETKNRVNKQIEIRKAEIAEKIKKSQIEVATAEWNFGQIYDGDKMDLKVDPPTQAVVDQIKILGRHLGLEVGLIKTDNCWTPNVKGILKTIDQYRRDANYIPQFTQQIFQQIESIATPLDIDTSPRFLLYSTTSNSFTVQLGVHHETVQTGGTEILQFDGRTIHSENDRVDSLGKSLIELTKTSVLGEKLVVLDALQDANLTDIQPTIRIVQANDRVIQQDAKIYDEMFTNLSLMLPDLHQVKYRYKNANDLVAETKKKVARYLPKWLGSRDKTKDSRSDVVITEALSQIDLNQPNAPAKIVQAVFDTYKSDLIEGADIRKVKITSPPKLPNKQNI